MNTFPVSEESSISWQRRMDAVARYMLLGNLRVVAEQMEMSYNTLSDWKRQAWWPEMVESIRRQKNQKKANSLETLVAQGVTIIQDRLEHGDFVLNQKTGEIVRKPVSLKDANVLVNQMIQRQNELEKIAQEHGAQQDNVQETLATIAKEFQKLTRRMSKDEATTLEVIDAVHDQREAGLQEREREIQQPS